MAQEVAGKLQSGANPLDFVKRNLAAMQAQTPRVDPAVALAAEEERRAAPPAVLPTVAAPVAPDPFEEPAPAADPETPPAPAADPETPPAAAEEPPAEQPTEDEPVAGSPAANFKQIRKVLHETKTQLSSTQQELKTAKEELDRYQRGEALPEVLQEKEAEISRLSRYEKLLSLKTSKEYQDKFVAPLTNINAQLVEIAKDYKLPTETLQRALRTSNRADLNRFLAQNFDDVGALEVKQLITQAQTLQKQAQDAEKEPQTALQQLLSEGEAARAQRVQQTRREMQVTSRQVWADAFKEVVEEGQAQELIYRADDPEHNKNYVEPIVKQAALEFGKIVTQLAENGLEKIPPALGHAMAKAVLLAHASAVALETRDAAARHADEVEGRVARLNKIYRPMVGSMAPGAETVPVERVAQTPTEAGRNLINSVLAKRRA